MKIVRCSSILRKHNAANINVKFLSSSPKRYKAENCRKFYQNTSDNHVTPSRTKIESASKTLRNSMMKWRMTRSLQETDLDFMKSVWEKYPSIPRFEDIASIHDSQALQPFLNDLYDNDWVATEKVHGCNFSIITDGKTVLGARRGSILEPDEEFFDGWQRLLENEKSKILNVFDLLRKENSFIRVVIIYGELFGRYFCHNDRKYSCDNIKTAIQDGGIKNGVYYTPNMQFYAFDIKTDCHKNDQRLEYYQSRKLFQESGLLHGDILQQGTFENVVQFDVESLQSTIPNLLGLPNPVNAKTGEPIFNLAEGIVVRKLKINSNILFKVKPKKFSPKKKRRDIVNSWNI